MIDIYKTGLIEIPENSRIWEASDAGTYTGVSEMAQKVFEGDVVFEKKSTNQNREHNISFEDFLGHLRDPRVITFYVTNNYISDKNNSANDIKEFLRRENKHQEKQ